MATVTVDADVDMCDFDTHEIISELRYRVKNGRKQLKESEKKEIVRLCNLIETGEDFPVRTLEDNLKYEVVNEAMKRFTISQLEERLK